MKIKTNNTYQSIFLVLLMVTFVFGWTASAAGKPISIAVLPFKINAQQDLAFLQNGIVDMLTSRLTFEDKVTVIGKQDTHTALENISGELTQKTARNVGVDLQADYVLFGSITVFGNSVSIDAKLLDVSGAKPPLAFFNQSQGMDEVIPKINQFATEINATVFGRVMPVQKVPATTQAAQEQPPQEQADARAHPETLIAGGFGDIDTSDVQNTAPGSIFIPTQKPQNQTSQFWRSQSFSHLINGLALGDVDGDGHIETVLVSDNRLIIFRMTNNRLLKIIETAETSNNHYIGVDIGDINGNGTPEIFITSLNALRNQVTSSVVEFDGKTYNQIVDKKPWYYRVIHQAGQGPVLFGQKHEAYTDNVFGPAVYKLAWENADYIPLEQVLPKRRANVMGVAYGDVLDANDPLVVAYDSSDRLQVVDTQGDIRWKGDEHYGGSTLYFVPPKTDRGEGETRRYYPMRLQLSDIDANGTYEVIAAKNHDVAGNRLSQFRHFTNTHFELLSWDGLGLASQWQTRKTSGHVRDFAIGDFDNDGQMELVAAMIIKEGATTFTKPKTAIIAYDLKVK